LQDPERQAGRQAGGQTVNRLIRVELAEKEERTVK